MYGVIMVILQVGKVGVLIAWVCVLIMGKDTVEAFTAMQGRYLSRKLATVADSSCGMYTSDSKTVLYTDAESSLHAVKNNFNLTQTTCSVPDRRTLLHHIMILALATPWPASAKQATAVSIANRFATSILQQPPFLDAAATADKNLYFPDYMLGTWQVVQTMVDTQTPLGKEYLGGPNADERIADAAIKQANEQLNRPVALSLRFVPSNTQVVEDRAYNTKQRLNAFAGRAVVSTVDIVSDPAIARSSNSNNSNSNILSTTFVTRFKGPAAQKTFITSRGTSGDGSSSIINGVDTTWYGYECQRSIFALTNTNTAPPVTTDTEILYQLQKVDDNHVAGKLRIASYLNAQSDKLYFDARQQAVSIQDYTINLVRDRSSI